MYSEGPLKARACVRAIRAVLAPVNRVEQWWRRETSMNCLPRQVLVPRSNGALKYLT